MFFSKQYSLISNNSSLPNYINYTTEKRLSTVTISVDDIGKIIQNLDSNKAHGHDNISIRMLKICGNSIYKPLEIIFRQALLTGMYPPDWKKGNIVPVQKKRDKQNIKNYRPVSLLRICGIIFNKTFRIFVSNNLNSLNQSGFKPGDSCINQLLSITPEIYKSFDGGLEVTGVFLDISKAFDKL